MKVYALLTGRGNNTLKDKNILDCLGHPVLYYPASAARYAKTVNRLFCSSDDDKMVNYYGKYANPITKIHPWDKTRYMFREDLLVLPLGIPSEVFTLMGGTL